MIQVVWFKRDLRTVDHVPLATAALAGPVLPLYVVEPDYWRLPDVSRRQWLAHRAALEELSSSLRALGAPLIVRTGRVVDVLAKIHQAVGIQRLLAHEETGNLWTFQRDRAVRAFCRRVGIDVLEVSQTGVLRGCGVGARDRWAERFARFAAARVVPEPACLVPVSRAKAAPLPTATDLGLTEDGCSSPQVGTRSEAVALIDSFLDGRGANYRRGMSSPISAVNACSRLSVSLATGAVSVREVLQQLSAARDRFSDCPAEERRVPITAIDSLMSRLHWRGHFMQKLESQPDLEVGAFHPIHESARIVTAPDDPMLLAWAEGRTGLPFVDACMRSLIATGWLNFRMRAMVQSFASYHLALDWRQSGARLARLFTDYEPGIHWPQVQMQSGQTGINTPRMYNPVKQGLDQDADGRFTRRWVPEVAHLQLEVLQTPWLSDRRPTPDYPDPIVDPVVAARQARARLTALRHESGYRDAALEVFRKHGSRRRRFEDGPKTQPPKSKRAAMAVPEQFGFSLEPTVGDVGPSGRPSDTTDPLGRDRLTSRV